MQKEILDHFGLKREIKSYSFFQNKNYSDLISELKSSLYDEEILVLSGEIGVGKTETVGKIKNDLIKEGEIFVATNITEKTDKVTINDLMDKLLKVVSYDETKPLTRRIKFYIEKFADILKRKEKPIALFVDEAHKLSDSTLINLKVLMEIVKECGGILCPVLIGHPRLKIELERIKNQEIGFRVNHIVMKGIQGCEEEFFDWLISASLQSGVKIHDVFNNDAKNTIITKLKTPLEIKHFTNRILKESYLIAEKPVSAETVNEYISKELGSIEDKITKLGYNSKLIGTTVGFSQVDMNNFFKNKLNPNRAIEITSAIQALGISI